MNQPRIYFDNAATTPLDPAVLEAMLPYYTTVFGNPSSIHGHGREARAAIERSRKTIAQLLGAAPSEIFFTSGGTEADNMALTQSIYCLGVRHVITSPLEHHAVLHCLEKHAKAGRISLHLLDVDALGFIDLAQLESLLARHAHEKVLVSLMHGNNEVGNLNDLAAIGQVCKSHGALFHSDTVQTMAHYAFDLAHTPINYVVGAAHKFHGPKGTGFLYISSDTKITPFILGGAQERNMRGGTENVAGIVGMAKAMELAHAHMAAERAHIEQLKQAMITGLRQHIDDLRFNGASADLGRSLYTVLNVSLPPSENADMLLMLLDIANISASGGSACSSGSSIGSHVLAALGASATRANVRFSFSKFNTLEEVQQVVAKVTELCPQRVTA